MNIIGIVCEYNPFHNGHIYQIKKIKELYPNSIIVIAMSSHFTERGEFSIINKWDKTKIALNYGVDVVLEIPYIFSNQSADLFAYAALKLLNEFKIDTIVFGSESADANKLINAAKVQLNNNEFDKLVKNYLDNGENYPTALSKTTKDLINIDIKESNDILAISYIKEIIKNNYDIKICPIRRTNDFKSKKINGNITSAFNIRNMINSNINISNYIPNCEIPFLYKINYDKYFEILKYKIISQKDNLDRFHLIDEGLENRIYESALISDNLNELIENIKTKRFTYNKINRILMNIYLNFTKEDAKKYNKLEYIRILGMSKNGKDYLNSIKKTMDLPIFTKYEKNDMLNKELNATMLYELLVSDKNLSTKEIKNHINIC